MAITNKQLAAELNRYMFSPMEMQAVASDMIRLATEGENYLVDASCPFVYLLEVATATAVNQNAKDESRARFAYSKLATNWEHLYRWMFDKAHVGRFAMPGQTEIFLVLGLAEILQRAVAVKSPEMSRAIDSSKSHSRKIVIPRTTVFTVAGMDFGLYYPIEIQVQAHDQVRVVWANDELNPLKKLETNQVEYGITRTQAGKAVVMRIPIFQFKTMFKEVPFNSTHGMNSSVTFEDKFYHCRAYASNEDGTWSELSTTHNAYVFDPTVPTIALQVEGQVLKWRVPEIYLSQNTLNNRSIRLEILTTKGNIHVDPADYNVSDWKDDYIDKGTVEEAAYSAPLSAFNLKGLYSEGALSGGRSSLSFDEQRARVMSGMNDTEIPITGPQVEQRLSSAGYGLVTLIDNLPTRTFLATRDIPQLDTTVPQAGTLIGSISATPATLEAHSYVRTNGERLTILPDAIYRNVDGVINLLPPRETDALYNGSDDYKLETLNQQMYFYSPFHYLLDSTGTFDVHPFYLDKPTVADKGFLDANETIPQEAKISKYSVTKIPTGYRIQFVVTGNKMWQEADDKRCWIQLSYKPKGESDYASMIVNGVKDAEGRRLFTFDVVTNFDLQRVSNDTNLDYDAFLSLTSFSMYDNAPAPHWAALSQIFEVFHVVTDYPPEPLPGLLHSPSDLALTTFLKGETGYTLYREQFTCNFGYDMDGLWSRSRVVASGTVYKKYPNDVPWIYESNQAKTDASGAVIIETKPDGSMGVVWEHKKGDPKLNSDGTPTIRYRGGIDVMRDDYGQPIPVSNRTTLRNMDLFFIDANYRLVNDDRVVAYRNQIPTTLIEWLKNDISTFKAMSFEETQFNLYPKQSLGYVDVVTENGSETTLPAALAFSVKLYLGSKEYADLELRSVLTGIVSTQLNLSLKPRTVSKAEMVSNIRTACGDSILNVEIEDFGPGKNLSIYTAKNDGVTCAVRKEMYLKADGVLGIREAIDVEFVRHAKTNSTLLSQGLRDN